MYTTDLLRYSVVLTTALLGAVMAAPTAPGGAASSTLSLPELIVVLKPTLQARGDEIPAPNAAVLDILKKHNAQIAPVFKPVNETEATALSARDTNDTPLPDLSKYFKVDAPQSELQTIAKDLTQSGQVDGAYVRPGASLPRIRVEQRSRTQDISKSNVLKRQNQTPNYKSRQGYLNAAPSGINAAFGNALAGGKGQGIRVVDCEWSWDFQHEDLLVNAGGNIFGPQGADSSHGTGVAGIISGDSNNLGVEGIVPEALFYGSSFENTPSIPTTIQNAANFLSAGDVILLEIQIGGPSPDPDSWIAVEWYPDVLDIIKFAVAKGIIVVEAAGNGNQNLDNPIYETGNGFPQSWRNPFNSSNPSSGAVLVGAGAPTEFIHGQSYGPERSRLWFSNYGSRVDAQGWGQEVTTTGTGDLFNGGTHRLYTDRFSGTSSASPIVTGALTAVLGILKQAGKKITSQQARTILRSTGSPQQDGQWGPVSQRIGNLPNLVQLIPAAQAIAQ